MKSMMATAFAILIGIAGTGFAGEGQNSFEDVDTNSDGTISKTEAQAVEGLDFDKADTNRDGQLSRSEYDQSDAKSGQHGGGMDDTRDDLRDDLGGGNM